MVVVIVIPARVRRASVVRDTVSFKSPDVSRFDYSINVEACGSRAECWKYNTNAGPNIRRNERFTASFINGLDKVRVVPGVYFTLSRNRPN
ncbi:hypothetical protein FHS76_003568 [Ochrobactrum daejeonense]|uniref:Uncharacterized protein n=1 Tax=Brucella daejeonensis TaxID=659015 RepID=A0A7W9AZY4_9HYPH|nr:hypothetical protein [Brucella daejeonensis]